MLILNQKQGFAKIKQILKTRPKGGTSSDRS